MNEKKIDLLWNYAEQQRKIAQNNGNLRTTFSSLIITLTVALLGVSFYGGKLNDISKYLLQIVALLNCYAAIMVRKLFERASFHNNRARIAEKKIDLEMSDRIFKKVKTESRRLTRRKFYIMIRMEVHWAWMTIHLIIFLFALTLFIP